MIIDTESTPRRVRASRLTIARWVVAGTVAAAAIVIAMLVVWFRYEPVKPVQLLPPVSTPLTAVPPGHLSN